MRKLRLGVAAGIIAVIATLVPASPASADVYAGVGVYTGTASTPGGLWFPASPFCPGIVPCPSVSTWSFTSTLDVLVSTYRPGEIIANPTGAPWGLVGAGRISGSGNLVGWCGHSQGTGSATIEGHTVGVRFITVGGTGLLVHDPLPVAPVTGPGIHSVGGVLVSAFQARPVPANVGDVPCLTVPARDFLIVGIGVGAAA